jgi:hypothetical protein
MLRCGNGGRLVLRDIDATRVSAMAVNKVTIIVMLSIAIDVWIDIQIESESGRAPASRLEKRSG